MALTPCGPRLLAGTVVKFLVLGMKSYGRGSAFLLRVGHEQVAMALALLEA
jgi:hypothetical protein